MRYALRKTTAVLAPGALALGLLSAGCSSSGSSGSSGAAPATLAAQNINAVPYNDVKSGGTLRLAYQALPGQFNVNQTNGATTSGNVIMDALMPTPFLTNSAGQVESDPAYVSSYKVVQADPTKAIPQSVTLELNQKAKWSNGQPITAHDYIAQWQALNGSNAKFDPAGSTGYEDIGDVTQGSNPYEVKYTFSTPFGEWASLFGVIYPAQYNATPSAFDNGYNNKIPVTAGPFKLDSINSSAQTVTLVRDPSFWWRPAKLNQMVFLTLDQSAAVQALANNEIDDDQIFNASQYDQLKSTPGVVARIAASETWPDLTFNGKNSILADVKVRQALGMALDRPAIIKSQMTGLPVPAIQPLDNHILLPQEPGYQDDSGQYGAYDPAQAEKILTQEGWVPGAGGVRYKDGKPLALTVSIYTGDAVSSSIAQLAQQMWAAVGIKISIQTYNVTDYFNDYFNVGNFQIALFEWTDGAFPVSGTEGVYQSPQNGNDFQNRGGIFEPQLDTLFTQALDTTNATQSHAIADKADALIWQEGHDLPLFTEPDIEMQKANLANWGAFDLGDADYTAVGYTS
jgi:peptide/nickel transport system substrate-binding protein